MGDLTPLGSSAEFIPQGVKPSHSEGNRIQSYLQGRMFSIWISIFLARSRVSDSRVSLGLGAAGQVSAHHGNPNGLLGGDLKPEVLLQSFMTWHFSSLGEDYSSAYILAWSACTLLSAKHEM